MIRVGLSIAHGVLWGAAVFYALESVWPAAVVAWVVTVLTLSAFALERMYAEDPPETCGTFWSTRGRPHECAGRPGHKGPHVCRCGEGISRLRTTEGRDL